MMTREDFDRRILDRVVRLAEDIDWKASEREIQDKMSNLRRYLYSLSAEEIKPVVYATYMGRDWFPGVTTVEKALRVIDEDFDPQPDWKLRDYGAELVLTKALELPRYLKRALVMLYNRELNS